MVKIQVRVKLFSKEEKVEKIPQPGFDFANVDSYTVWVKEAPEDGKANDAVIRTLANYFDISKSSIKLISGATNRDKVFDIHK